MAFEVYLIRVINISLFPGQNFMAENVVSLNVNEVHVLIVKDKPVAYWFLPFAVTDLQECSALVESYLIDACGFISCLSYAVLFPVTAHIMGASRSCNLISVRAAGGIGLWYCAASLALCAKQALVEQSNNATVARGNSKRKDSHTVCRKHSLSAGSL